MKKETNKEKITRLEKEIQEKKHRQQSFFRILQEKKKELHLTKKKLAYVRKQIINKEETIQWLFERLREYEKKDKLKYGFNNSVNVARTKDNI